MGGPSHQPATEPTLAGVRLKLARADQHLGTLHREISAYVESDPYDVVGPTREGDQFTLRLKVRRQPDPAWGLIAGELLHNSRSALDNLVWQLVLLNREAPGHQNQFPIYTRHPRRDRIALMLPGVRSDHRCVIEELQPYQGPHVHRQVREALANLVEMSNTDKHRYLHAAIGVLDPRESSRTHIVCTHPFEWIANVPARLQDGEVVAALQTHLEAKLRIEGTIAHDVALGRPWATVAFYDAMYRQIELVPDRFAPSFEEVS